MTVMAERPGSLGFAAPRAQRMLSRQRAAVIELIAMFSLTVSLVIAIAAVSLGNRLLSRDDGFERPVMPARVDVLIDQASDWFALKATQ
jgi:hypothetical protein